MKKGSVQMQQQQNKTNKEKKSSIPKTEQEKDEVDKTKKKLDLKEKLNIEDDPTIDQQVKNPMQESSLTKMRKTSYFETILITINDNLVNKYLKGLINYKSIYSNLLLFMKKPYFRKYYALKPNKNIKMLYN